MQQNNYLITVQNLDPEKTLLLPISPDQKYHNGDMFSAILNFTNENNLNVEIIIADTLRRFTYEMTGTCTPNAALKNSINLGEKWKEKNLNWQKNKEVYETLQKNQKIKVIHWNHFKLHHKEKLAELTKIVLAIYENKDNSFYKAVNEAKNVFCKTFHQKNENNPLFDEKKAELINIEYLLEEYTVTLLWNTLGYCQLAYPVLEGITNKKLLFSGLITLQNEIEKISDSKNLLNFNQNKMKFLELSIQSNYKKNNEKSRKKKIEASTFSLPTLQKNSDERNLLPSLAQDYGQHGIFKQQKLTPNNIDNSLSIMTESMTKAILQMSSQDPATSGELLKIAFKSLLDAFKQNSQITVMPINAYPVNTSFTSEAHIAESIIKAVMQSSLPDSQMREELLQVTIKTIVNAFKQNSQITAMPINAHVVNASFISEIPPEKSTTFNL